MSLQQAQYYCPQCRQTRLFTRQGTNNVLHLLLVLFLCGLWLPVWILIVISEGNAPYFCTQCGYADKPQFLLNPALKMQQAQSYQSTQHNSSSGDPTVNGVMRLANKFIDLPTVWQVGIVAACVIGLVGVTVAVSYQTDKNEQTRIASQKYAQFTPTPTPETDFSQLTFKSTYYDVIRILGKPDKEGSSVPPEAQIPNTMLAYKSKGIIIFLVYDMPYKGKLDKTKTHYLGAKGFNPERVVHAVDDRARTLLDAYKFSELK